MRKIFQLLGRAEPLAGEYGIEIEAEGENMRAVDNKWWGTHNDGSLRGDFPESRAEYVLNAPVAKKDVKAVLKVLAKALEEATFKFSFRTSVHVHMNVQELEWSQVLSVIYTYLLLEEPLLNYCGRTRKANRFCLRLQDAEGILDTLHMMFGRGEGGFDAINQENVRYASINVGALTKYGSLEFRGMRGTMDIEVLTTWIDALHNIKTYALKFKGPNEILEEFQKLGSAAFMKKVLGKVNDAFLYARADRDIERSYSLSMELPYTYKGFLDSAEKMHKAKEGKIAVENLPFLGRNMDQGVVKQVRKDAENMIRVKNAITVAYREWIQEHDPAYYEHLVQRGIIKQARPIRGDVAGFAQAVLDEAFDVGAA